MENFYQKNWGNDVLALDSVLNFTRVQDVITRMQTLAKESSEPINLVINAPKFSLSGALLLMDSVIKSSSPIHIFSLRCAGLANGVLSCGTPGNRVCYATSTFVLRFAAVSLLDDPYLTTYVENKVHEDELLFPYKAVDLNPTEIEKIQYWKNESLSSMRSIRNAVKNLSSREQAQQLGLHEYFSRLSFFSGISFVRAVLESLGGPDLEPDPNYRMFEPFEMRELRLVDKILPNGFAVRKL